MNTNTGQLADEEIHRIVTEFSESRNPYDFLDVVAEIKADAYRAGQVAALTDAADELEETLAGWVLSMGPSDADTGTWQAIESLRARADELRQP